MRAGFIPWPELMLQPALRLQHAACFALGCLEREHRLNVDALMAYWTQAPMAWWAPAFRPSRAGTREYAAQP